jgi:oligoendopeptidase F
MTTETLPRWDMTVIYPGLESPEFESGYQSLIETIDSFGELIDKHEIRKQSQLEVDDLLVGTFDKVLDRYNQALEESRTMRAYIQSFITTDSRNTLAQAKWSALQPSFVKFAILGTRLTAWLGSMDVEELIEKSDLAGRHAFRLRKAYIQAQHLMLPEMEELAAELKLTGGSAWENLHGDISSQLIVPVEMNGKIEELPMSAIRNLAHSPDQEVRRRGYEAELAAWQRAEIPLAAAMNGIKGEVNTLAKRRGWESGLELALFHNHMDRTTLDAMLKAAHEYFPDFRRYLKAKAKLMGAEALPWYDLFAPVGEGGDNWSYERSVPFVLEQFASFSPKMNMLAQRAFDENWIDVPPSNGKRDGAFCMGLRGDESRILTNFKPSYAGVSTLAHELGHAYHNLNLSGRKFLQRSTPMTLAETASNFCETIIRQAAMENASEEERFLILEAWIQDACQVVVDITSRFIFEETVFNRRLDRELSVDELNQVMIDAQKETYGDGLDPDLLHPYMWAVKPHYYSANLSFYNFPYMFGLLFSLGLYARYQQAPQEFPGQYDDLLSSTGMGNAAELTQRFGIDIRTPEFWRSSLDLLRADIDQFVDLVK